MSKVHNLTSVQKLPVSLEKTWKFFSDAHNLLTITPPFLNLTVTNEVFGDEVYAGQIISYKVKPLAGIAVSWTTEITHIVKEKMFVDQQIKGPYKLWHHQHHFKSIEGGTEMTDVVHYSLPFGLVGELTHSIVKRKLMEIFTYRFDKINEVFGRWPDQKLSLKMD
ncbi:MAG TPA: SRPBCC family protein [Flavisolibacter sp.]|jgi:ligand-binding SRPBCC domain-containing protein|nr:SRPBCC family protein [Flavisolibacter sp.]